VRIGVFIETSPGQGCFRQSVSVVESLTRPGALRHDVIVFCPLEQTRCYLRELGIEAIPYKRRLVRLVDRWSATTVGAAVLGRLRRLGLTHLGRHLDALLDKNGIDLVLLNENGEASLRIGAHPFIVTMWDVDHRDHPEFPEWFSDRGFEREERALAVTLTRALAVVANSASGARRLCRLYNVDPERVVQMPFLPSVAVRRHAAGQGKATVDSVQKKYGLTKRYVFYPAFYAFHKNHLYLLEALVDLEQRHGVVLHAVFCGGSDAHPGTRETVERQVRALGLSSRVHLLGLVPDEDVPPLYEGALALVMPTYFGPTNVPPLEAVVLGCPVIYSDLPGCREQLGHAALYCMLDAPASLADQLEALIRDGALRERLRESGRRLAAEIAAIDYAQRLAPLLDDYADVRRRWSWPQ
jgi:glycosyltransferase involved in cell wall biosynthesis